MSRRHTGEMVESRAIALHLPPDGELTWGAVVQAAALLTAPRLVVIEGHPVYRYAVSLLGGPAVLEFDFHGFPSPLMTIRASAGMKAQAEELFDRIEEKFAVLCPPPAAVVGIEDSDDLPF